MPLRSRTSSAWTATAAGLFQAACASGAYLLGEPRFQSALGALQPLMRALVALFGTAFVLACLRQSGSAHDQAALEPATNLRSAPYETSIRGHSLRLEANAGLNLMPGPSFDLPGPARSPAHIIIWLSSADSAPIAADVRIDSAYVFHGDSVWADSPRAEQTERFARGRGTIVRRLDDGPLWIYKADSLDIFLRLIDTRTKSPVLIRAPRAALQRDY